MLTRVPTSTLLLKISLSSSGKLTSVAHILTQPPYPTEVCVVFLETRSSSTCPISPCCDVTTGLKEVFWGVSGNFFKCEFNLRLADFTFPV
ncbi:hypothetical protein QQF64_013447 [Cirrhinus molitorella]|uniref:Uncharacterized protein n=1 Tax=Cirrhinus molitorella TaxID=172907 RepID=A0ABR3LTT4_9TELE